MARTSTEIINDEGVACQAWCPKHGVIANDEGNLNFIIEYFMNWQEMITEQTLELAYTTGVGFKDRLKHYAPGQQEFAKLFAALSPEEQKAFGEPGWGYGLKDDYQNGIAILSWLAAHKMKVTKQSLNLACGQNNVVPHLVFDENATRAQNRDKNAERKRVQSGDDGKPFGFGDGMVKTPDGGWRSMTPLEQKRAKEAAEAAKNKTVQESSSTPDFWSQSISQLLQWNGTARQREEIKTVHDYYVQQGYTPRQLYPKLARLVERYKEAR